MTTFTKNEQAAFNAIATESYGGGVGDIDVVCAATGLAAKAARGVIGSLVKKNKIDIDEFQNGFEPVQLHYWPVHPTIDDARGSFWTDVLTEDEYKAGLITDDQVK